MDSAIVIIAVIVGAPLATLIANHFSRPKVKADVSESFNRMALQLITPQAARIQELETQMLSCQFEIRQFRLWAKLLASQVIELGGIPITIPDVSAVRSEYRR